MDLTTYESVIAPRYTGRIGKSFVEKFNHGANETILDLACRTGNVTVELLHRLGPKGRIIALDNDPEMLNLARTKVRQEAGKRIFFATSTPIDQWHFEDEVFTSVIGNLAFDELVDSETTLKGIPRVLTPGGRLLITRLLRGSFQEVLDMFKEVALAHHEEKVLQRIATIHERYVEESTYAAFFEHLGFDEVTVESMEFSLSFPTGSDVFSDPLVHHIVFKEWEWISQASSQPEQLLSQVQNTLETYFAGQSVPLTLRYGLLQGRRASK